MSKILNIKIVRIPTGMETLINLFALQCILHEEFIFSVKCQSTICCKFFITCSMVFGPSSSITNKETLLLINFHVTITFLTE